MKTILLLTVGGSHVPIINAVREYQPDFTYFICSCGQRGSEKTIDGAGKPCGDLRKCPHCHAPLGKAEESISHRLKLRPDQYGKILLDDPDDLDECYQKLSALFKEICAQEDNPCRIVANYTGGTKTMSVTLALLGVITPGCELSLNKGLRKDLIKVITGDVPVSVDKWNIFAQMQLDTARGALANFDYSGTNDILAQISKRPLEKGLQGRVIYLRQLCRAFDAWDKFKHREAMDLLALLGGKTLAPYLIALKRIAGAIKSCHGYEKVMDLVLNSRRRASQQRYDDAVARLYRAIELLAQIRLLKDKGIDSADVKLEQLPESLGQAYQARQKDGRIAIGLAEDYGLLEKLNDPIGQLFAQQKNKILEAIKKRNFSILAHGLTPITEDDFLRVSMALSGFIDQAFNLIPIGQDQYIPQLPREDLLNFYQEQRTN